MTQNFNNNTDNNPTWLTPKYIIEALGPFDLDPCCPPVMPWKTAETMYSLPETDGLKAEWKGRVWLNPPYGHKIPFLWLDKLSDHKSGIAIIFARTETKGFHQQIWDKARGIFFFEGRINFLNEQGESVDRSNAPSCLISYSDEDNSIIVKAWVLGKIKGKMVYLNGA